LYFYVRLAVGKTVLQNLSLARSCIAVFVITAALLVASATRADVVSFDGKVQRSDTFVHRFSHDATTYEFRLVPVSHGWQIWIGDPAQRKLNYVTVATPPFRGINSTQIEGWHFRNVDNTAPNEPGTGNVNAPQRERWFAFTPDDASHLVAADALEILLWPNRRQAAEIDAAKKRFRQIPKIKGLLQIEALELGNLTAAERAWIERMAFSVSIDLPN